MESFETYRPLLFSIAYRMTGSVMEAEDLVQETFLRASSLDPDQIDSPRALLTTILTRQAINVLNSARMRREEYLGPWLPEPLATAGRPQWVRPVEDEGLDDSISTAFLVLLEQLTPLERAVFLLKEVFDYSYGEIAQILDRTEAACRKLGARAKRHLIADRPRFQVSAADYQSMAARFIEACLTGDLDGLVALLAQEATIITDGGGKAVAGTRPVSGQEIVARFILGGLRMIADQPYTWEVVELNGKPGIVVRIDGQAFGVVQFDLGDREHIQDIHFITNPDKLGHL